MTLEREGGRFGDVITDYRILTEADKVRKNSSDDYGLGPDWFFVGGTHVNSKWTVVYGRFHPDVRRDVERSLVDGETGAVQLYLPNHSRTAPYFVVSARCGIGSVVIADITDVPEDVVALIHSKGGR